MKYRIEDIPQAAEHYDALIAVIGFESRGTHVLTQLSGRFDNLHAFDYASVGLHAYDTNRTVFAEALPMPMDEPEEALRQIITAAKSSRAPSDSRPPKIAIDFSCMDRDLLGRCVSACMDLSDMDLDADFYYSVGEYEDGIVGSEGVVQVNRSAHGYSGWPADPDSPLTCLLGLGFESRLALAALETLEPTSTMLLLPIGDDPRFDETVETRNSNLLNDQAFLARTHRYHVANMIQTVSDLSATVGALSARERVVIVPLGPKPFAWASFVVSHSSAERPSVWRLSAASAREPEDRRAAGPVAGARIATRI